MPLAARLKHRHTWKSSFSQNAVAEEKRLLSDIIRDGIQPEERKKKKKLHKHENFPLANCDRLQTCSHAHWASPLSSSTGLCSFWDLVLVICRTLIIGNKASSYHSIYGVLRSDISDEVKDILSVWVIHFGTISLPVIVMTGGEEVYSGNKWQR